MFWSCVFNVTRRVSEQISSEKTVTVHPSLTRRVSVKYQLQSILVYAFICCYGCFISGGFAVGQTDSTEESHSTPAIVTVGAYLNDIQSLNLREHTYAVDLYLWFRWKDENLNPAETVEMVNPSELWGHVSKPQYEAPIQLPNGEFYQVLRIQGRFAHKFVFSSFPYDLQELMVQWEDSVHEVNRMVYLPDTDPMAANPRLILPGFQIQPLQFNIERYEYPTTFGDTRRSEPHTYSRVTLSIPIRRPIWTSSLKLLLPVMCVVFGASIMLRLNVRLIDARLGIGITSLLTVVAIQLAANETLPNVDYLVLIDKIHLAAYAYVLAGLGIVLATVRTTDRDQFDEAQSFQRRGYWLTTCLFVITVAALIGFSVATQ
jgi:hypothetical protein